ncbi:MAG: hypothetical protein U0231_00060 [Nitrospiraceae bacterium]
MGLMIWSQSSVTNTNVPIWVTDPGIAQVDEVKPIADTAVDRVRSVPGVVVAVPHYRAPRTVGKRGHHQITLVGLESATLIGRSSQVLDDDSRRKATGCRGRRSVNRGTHGGP